MIPPPVDKEREWLLNLPTSTSKKATKVNSMPGSRPTSAVKPRAVSFASQGPRENSAENIDLFRGQPTRKCIAELNAHTRGVRALVYADEHDILFSAGDLLKRYERENTRIVKANFLFYRTI